MFRVFLLSLLVCATYSVSVYDVTELTFAAPSVSVTNPFLDANVTVTASASTSSEAPRGSSPLTFHGFYNGNNTWVVRVSFPAAGTWTWKAASVPAGIVSGSASGSVVVTAARTGVHGAPTAKDHVLMYEDGTVFTAVGIEVDWLWALGLEPDSTPTELEPFLDTLSYGGFNTIVLQLYANFSTFGDGGNAVQRPERVSPTTATPWSTADMLQFDLAYFAHYDTMMDALAFRGITAHLMITVWNKHVNWPAHDSVADNLYWLVTMHSLWGHSTPLKEQYCDMISDQQHSDFHGHILSVRQQFPSKPILNIEFQYEQGVLDPYFSDTTVHASLMRKTMWSLYMAGGYGIWYYDPIAWDIIVPSLVPPGYTYCRVLRAFFEGVPYTELQPDDAVVASSSTVYALRDQTRFIVYVDTIAPFTVMSGLPPGTSVANGTWTDPQTGLVSTANATGTVGAGGNITFTPPSRNVFTDLTGDAVLYVTFAL